MDKYSLIIEGSTYFRKEIQFNVLEKKTSKTNLQNIDQFTTNFSDITELKEYLISKMTDIKSIDNIYIKDSKGKRREIAFKDKNMLSNLDIVENKIDTSNQFFKKFLFDFLKNLENTEFYDYASKNINNPLSFAIDKRIILGDYSLQTTNDIIYLLEDYNVFRDTLSMYNTYKISKLKKQNDKIQQKYQKILKRKD